jgi:hypothetical protein
VLALALVQVQVLAEVLAQVQARRENQAIHRVLVLHHHHPADHRVVSDLLLLRLGVELLPLLHEYELLLQRVVEPLQLLLLRDVWLPLLLHV